MDALARNHELMLQGLLLTRPLSNRDIRRGSASGSSFAHSHFQSKRASVELGELWNSVAAGSPEPSAGREPPRQYVPRHPQDNVENRDLKQGYSGVNRFADSLVREAQQAFRQFGPGTHPDPRNPAGQIHVARENGWVVVRTTWRRKDGSEGWREIRYDLDRPDDVDVRWDEGASVSRRGRNLYAELPDGTHYSYHQDEDGRLTLDHTDQDGRRTVSVAQPDGSHRWTGADGVTRVYPADPEMARYQEIASRMARVVEADGSLRKVNDEELYILVGGLRRYDMTTLENLERSGIHIRLVDHQNPPPGGYPGGLAKWKRGGLGYYDRNQKVIVLRRTDFRNGGARQIAGTIRHEVAHAVDDMLMSDPVVGRATMATEHDPRLRELYRDYLARGKRDRGQVWSHYARSQPAEYFAEGVRMYMGTERQRARLREKDPRLYAYVEEVLARSRDRALPDRQWHLPSPWEGRGAPSGSDSIWGQLQALQQARILQMMQMMYLAQMRQMVFLSSMMGFPYLGFSWGF